jgi:hypothetical protein
MIEAVRLHSKSLPVSGFSHPPHAPVYQEMPRKHVAFTKNFCTPLDKTVLILNSLCTGALSIEI